jgi:LL-diaminopimelate aminotransferase
VVKKAKIMWVNYPGNPTGAMATKAFYKKVIDFGHDHNIVIASDECYTEMYYDEKPMSILELTKEGVVSVQSMSKRSNMTGWRIGWVAGDENIVSVFKKVKTNIDSGTATFIQDATVAALSDEKHVEDIRKEYRQKRDIMVTALTGVGLPDCTPAATFYIWQEVPAGMKSVEFAKRLLAKEIAVVTTPGAWLSKDVNGLNPGEGYVRFALVPTIEQCHEAATRIKKYLR